MAIYHIFDAFNNANWADIQISPAYNVGTPFTVNRVMFLTKVGWYRSRTGSGGAITTIGVWDTTTSAAIVQINAFTDSGAVGWQWTTLPSPLGLAPNREYRVAALIGNNQYHARYTLGTPPTPPDPLYFGGNYRCYVQSGSWAYPNTLAAQFLQAVDVEVDDTGTGDITPPSTSGDIDNALADWLSYADQTHGQDSLPARNNTAIASVASDVADVLTSVGTAIGANVSSILTSVGAGLSGKVDDVKGVVDSISNVVGATTGLLDALDNYVRNSLGGVSGLIQTLSDAEVAVINALGDLLRTTTPVPGTGWTMLAETDFDTELAWAQEADLYILSFTSPPASLAPQDVAGVTVLYRLLWWAELVGTMAGERHYLDMPGGHITMAPHRMAGLLLRCYGPALGHVQAWVQT